LTELEEKKLKMDELQVNESHVIFRGNTLYLHQGKPKVPCRPPVFYFSRNPKGSFRIPDWLEITVGKGKNHIFAKRIKKEK